MDGNSGVGPHRPAGTTQPPTTGNPSTEPATSPLRGLEESRTPERSLHSRAITPGGATQPTEGISDNPPRTELLQKRKDILKAVTELSVQHSNNDILTKALETLTHPDKPPKGIAIKVLIGGKMVSFIPPDAEGLEGQDLDKLMENVKSVVVNSHAKHKETIDPQPLKNQFNALLASLEEVSQQLGGEAEKKETITELWDKAYRDTPKEMEIEYPGGTVLIERIKEPDFDPENRRRRQRPSSQPPLPSRSQE